MVVSDDIAVDDSRGVSCGLGGGAIHGQAGAVNVDTIDQTASETI